MAPRWRFDRRELAGSLGDLGTLLPIIIGLVSLNGMHAMPILLCVGLYYVASGAYFGVPTPVQPMKVVGAYAIALALEPAEITSAGLWLGGILLLLAATRAITFIADLVPRSVVRGVQLTTGVLLLLQGVRFVLGESSLQQSRGLAEPFLSVQALGPVPLGIIIGVVAFVTILVLLDNKVAPAGLVVVVAGAVVGLALGAHGQLAGLEVGFHLPELLPYGMPTASHLVVGLTVLALPQIPMTLGNAVVAQADLSEEYFGKDARRSTTRAITASMGLANLAAVAVGGMPMCHGAGGLAAHYRFGARTAGSNVIIGVVFVAAALLVGDQGARVLSVLPFSVLGALLVFAGAQLAMMIGDISERRHIFVVVLILGVSLATTLAWGFAVGLVLAWALRHPKLNV